MKVAQYVIPFLAALAKGATGSEANQGHLKGVESQDTSTKETPSPVNLSSQEKANLPIGGTSTGSLSGDSINETPEGFEVTAIPTEVKKFLDNANSDIEAELLTLAESGGLEKLTAEDLTKRLLQKLEARIPEDNDNTNQDEKTQSDFAQAIFIAAELGGVGLLTLAYLYAITIKAPPGTNAVELAAAFALEHGATIAATAAPIPGAYAGYQLAGTTGAIAGGVAGHLAGAASNPETREQLQELGTLLKDRASDAYGHYSQQARESYNHYSQQAGQAIDQARHDAVNRYNAARDGAVDGYNRLRDGAVNRAQQAGQALSETYTQTRDSVGQGAQQVKDFALEQGPKIAATAAPIPGAYAGYQLTGTTTGAIAGGVAGHLAGAALNPETREPLQELITLLKNRASGGVTHYSQQAGQAIGQARDGAVNGYNTVRNGAVNGYNTVRNGAVNRTQQARDAYTQFTRQNQQILWQAGASALASVLASVYNGHSLTTTAIAAPAYAVALPYAINNAQDVLVGAARVVNGARQVANGAGQVVNSARELAANPETRKVARDAAAGAVVGGLAAAGTEHVTGAAIGGAATVAAGGAAIRHFSGEPT